ncbi:MAG TPA: hypothetical protein VKY53_04715 [Marinobacter sp.]|nr:hypothetical protein [Marinobacter sp.]
MHHKNTGSHAHYSMSETLFSSLESQADWARVLTGVGEFLLLGALVLMVPAVVYFDVAVLGNSVGEISATEIAQELLVLMTAAIFGYKAFREPRSRGFLVLVAGFFSVILIRELDSFLDAVVHGFWVWPATAAALSAIFMAKVPFKGTVLRPMADYVGTKPYYFMVIGLVTLLFFSRVFGSGNLLWGHLLGDAYTSGFKAGLQEGLELLGYILIGYSAVLFSRSRS